MPKVAKELSALEVKNLPPGSHAVGGVAGLILEVTPTGGKTWVLRVRTGTKRREIGLGATHQPLLRKPATRPERHGKPSAKGLTRLQRGRQQRPHCWHNKPA